MASTLVPSSATFDISTGDYDGQTRSGHISTTIITTASDNGQTRIEMDNDFINHDLKSHRSADYQMLTSKAIRLLERLQETFRINDELRLLVNQLCGRIKVLETRLHGGNNEGKIPAALALFRNRHHVSTNKVEANPPEKIINQQLPRFKQEGDWREVPAVWTLFIVVLLVNLISIYAIVSSIE